MITLILFHNDWIKQKYDCVYTSSSIFITKISQTINRTFHSLYSKIEHFRIKTKKKDFKNVEHRQIFSNTHEYSKKSNNFKKLTLNWQTRSNCWYLSRYELWQHSYHSRNITCFIIDHRFANFDDSQTHIFFSFLLRYD